MGQISASTENTRFSEHGRSAWAKYQVDHDVAPLRGSVAAIEPESGRVWIGDDALIAIDKMKSDGLDAPVFLVRIGFDYLDVKGRR